MIFLSAIIILIILFIIILLFLIKNNKAIFDSINKIDIKYKKIIIIIIYILSLLLISVGLFALYKNCKKMYNQLSYGNVVDISDEKIANEKEYYNNLMKQDYQDNFYTPYIPEGFEYVEGTYDTGFVIQDDNQNQYVWVPCTNKDLDNISKLIKKDFSDLPFIQSSDCYDDDYKTFMESSLKHGGFYISRYEIGKENDKYVSKANVKPYSNMYYEEAEKAVETMQKENVHIDIINGYAYDTTLNWITMTNIVEQYKVEPNDAEFILTGRNMYNNIYDFTDNVLEYSAEWYFQTKVIRGFSYVDSTELTQIEFSKLNRYSMLNTNMFSNYDLLSIRVIMYEE